MNFEFATASKIVFAPGCLTTITSHIQDFGNKALIVCGSRLETPNILKDILDTHGIESGFYQVSGEPDVEAIHHGVNLARAEKSNIIIGIGGGSVLDAGKAIAALITNSGDILEYMEVIGKGKPITNPPIPYVAIPTTAGTGSEVTRNAVISSPEYDVKVSLRSPMMLPRLALIDPELTYTLPPEITANTGLDALTQLIEPFLSPGSNPITDSICRSGIKMIAESIVQAYEMGNDFNAREQMALASLFGGIALANAKLGAVHGFSGPLGGLLSAPHGAICARLLPIVMQVNLNILLSRYPSSSILERFEEIASLLTRNPSAKPEEGINWLHWVCQRLKIKSLGEYGLTPHDFSVIIEKASVASSMKGNPVTLEFDEMYEILNLAM